MQSIQSAIRQRISMYLRRYKAALVAGAPEAYKAEMSHQIRWGILSTGTIAKTFAEGLAVLPDAELIAVGSRTQASADSFGKLFDVPRCYASYEALLHTAVRTETPQEAIIMGTEGRLKIHAPWWRGLTLSFPRQPDELIDVPYHGNGYNYEAPEVMRCLRAGKVESDTMPHQETIMIMQTMAQIRAQWGLRYPSER